MIQPRGEGEDDPTPQQSTGEFAAFSSHLFTNNLQVSLIAFALGITLGYLISRSQYSIRVFEPLFAGVYSVPMILFLPLYILFFGLGPPSKIAIGTTISFFPIILNTIAGFGYVERIFILSARSMGASEFQLFRCVLLPAAFPVILTGLRIGFTVALLSILGSETIASLSGLGHRIVQLAESMHTPVATTLNGKSAFPEDHPLALGTAGRTRSATVDRFFARADAHSTCRIRLRRRSAGASKNGCWRGRAWRGSAS